MTQKNKDKKVSRVRQQGYEAEKSRQENKKDQPPHTPPFIKKKIKKIKLFIPSLTSPSFFPFFLFQFQIPHFPLPISPSFSLHFQNKLYSFFCIIFPTIIIPFIAFIIFNPPLPPQYFIFHNFFFSHKVIPSYPQHFAPFNFFNHSTTCFS